MVRIAKMRVYCPRIMHQLTLSWGSAIQLNPKALYTRMGNCHQSRHCQANRSVLGFSVPRKLQHVDSWSRNPLVIGRPTLPIVTQWLVLIPHVGFVEIEMCVIFHTQFLNCVQIVHWMFAYFPEWMNVPCTLTLRNTNVLNLGCTCQVAMCNGTMTLI